MTTSDALYAQGQEVRRRFAGGGTFVSSQPGAQDLAPGLSRIVDEALFGAIWSRPQLDIRYRSLATISVLTVLQRLPQLKTHVRNGLNLGLSPATITEAMVHLVFYGGLPAALNALQIAGEVFAERPEWQRAVQRPQPPRSATLEERVQLGNEMRRRLWGQGEARQGVAAAEELAPDFIRLVDAYLFGEIYYRPHLDLKQRAVCTLAALTALGKERQLHRHLRSALRVGLSRQEVVEVLCHTAFYCGLPSALNALGVAREVFQEVAAS
ncbi:MAG: carboxymuconolactone decarboxylase family protein [Dehalococcoidia bacterium]